MVGLGAGKGEQKLFCPPGLLGVGRDMTKAGRKAGLKDYWPAKKGPLSLGTEVYPRGALGVPIV